MGVVSVSIFSILLSVWCILRSLYPQQPPVSQETLMQLFTHLRDFHKECAQFVPYPQSHESDSFCVLLCPPHSGQNISAAFMQLPPKYDFPDYYATMKKPISFAEVKVRVFSPIFLLSSKLMQTLAQGKLDRKGYSSLKQLADDFHQMFVNAKRYNQKGSEIFDNAKRLDVSTSRSLTI